MAKNPLKYQPHEYSTYNLLHSGKLSQKEMEREYNRLRQLANSRLERLGKSEFKGVEAYTRNIGHYTKPASQYSKEQLARKLFEVSKFIGAESSSIRGQQRIRKKTIEKLHAAGYDFINKDNLKAFGDFMEDMRSRSGGHLVDSDRVAEVFGVARELGVDSKSLERDFDFWLANKDKLENMPKAKGKKHDSQIYLNKLYRKGELETPEEYKYSKNGHKVLERLSKTSKKEAYKQLKRQGVTTSTKTKDINLDDYFQ